VSLLQAHPANTPQLLQAHPANTPQKGGKCPYLLTWQKCQCLLEAIPERSPQSSQLWRCCCRRRLLSNGPKNQKTAVQKSIRNNKRFLPPRIPVSNQHSLPHIFRTSTLGCCWCQTLICLKHVLRLANSVEKENKTLVSARSLHLSIPTRPRYGTATYEIEGACFGIEAAFICCALPHPLSVLVTLYFLP